MSALAMAILLNGMDRARDRPLDRRDDRLGRADGLLLAVPARPPTSTPPAASATRSRCRWRRWSPPAASPCPQLSGRGLGHTGGTLDKLESIPGWRAALSNEEMLAQLEDVGAVICAAGDGLAPGRQEALRAARRHRHRRGDPADRLARSCRKKIAEGTGALVLDVKVGTGAFMKDVDRRPRARRDDGRARHRRRRAHGRAAHRHVHPARPHRRQRDRGRRVGRGARRRRSRRRRRADPRAGPRDARRGRASTTSTRPTGWPTAPRWTPGRR